MKIELYKIELFYTWASVLIQLTNAEYDNCFDDVNKVNLACNPPAYDVMWNNVASIKVEPASATCGSPPTTFRRLAIRMPSTYETCDANSPVFQHPPVHMIDDNTTTTWWQSVNLSPGAAELNINITISFNKSFRMDSDVVITFNSGRPDKMILLKSMDYGVTWTPLQFYAYDCDSFQGVLLPGAEITVENPTAVICSEEYAEQTSRTAARVVANRNVKLVNQDRFDLYLGLLGINISNFYEALEQKLLDFLTFTDIRIQLIQPFTDARGLYDAYYYAISDVQAVARCYCNLHAADCNYTSQGITCDCQHNTMGKNCELCQPLYNERPWKKGSYIPYPRGQANECLKCECNDHAVSCTYNATYGRGVCDACLHNTRGYHCELCALTFYPNVSLPQYDVNRCIDCACEPLGVDGGNLNCSQTDTVGTVIGQCPCKQYVTSRKCDTCVSGYYGLLTGPTPGTCVACTCVQDGTVDKSINCTQDTGQCTCKQTITGRTCDTCRDGYYSFPTGNPQKECSNCNCDKGGAVSPVCDKMTGVCACRANITESKCTLPAKGTYVPSLDTLIYQPVTGGCWIISDLYTDQTPFDGTSFAVCDLFNGTVSVDFEPVVGGHVQKNIQWPYILAVRYSTNSSALSGTVKLQVSGNTTADLTPLSLQLGQAILPVCPFIGQTEQVDIKFTPGKSLAVLSQPQNVTIDARCAYNLTLLLYSTETSQSGNLSATVNGVSSSGSMITIDSMLLLPTLTSADGATSFGVYVAAENKTITQEMYLTCLQQLSSLLTRQITLTTSCHDILFSVGAELFNGSKSCGCHAISSVTTITCQELGGQCQCKSGVSGRTCDICTPGYFNFTDNGCSRCPVLPCALEVINISTTTASPNTTTPATNVTVVSSSDSGLSGGYIALIVICAALFVCIIVLLIWCCLAIKRKRKKKTVTQGLYLMTQLGLGDPNSRLYRGNIYDQHSHLIEDLVDPHEQLTALAASDKESDSVFESPYSRPKFYIASDDNASSLDHKKKPKSNLNKSNVFNAVKPKLEERYIRLSLPEDPLKVDFRPDVDKDLYLRKSPSRNKNYHANDSTRLTHWRPMSDLRLTDYDNDGKIPQTNEHHKIEFQHLSKSPNKPLKKSPQKPARKNKPARKSSLLDKILPPPLMYGRDSPAFIPEPYHDTSRYGVDNPSFIPDPDYDTSKYGGDNSSFYTEPDYYRTRNGRDKPIFIPEPDYDTLSEISIFIPRRDYSFIGRYDNPVFIPEPDYPRYAGYACYCHPKGAETGSCDPSGRCSCKKNILQGNVTSALDNNGTSIRIDGTCSHCLPNYFGIESGQGCSPCNCSVDGSTSLQCDETGQCPCKDTVTGLKCDACKDGFYGFGPNGCSSCNCSSSGSLNVTCHQITGACNCRNNVEGSKCNLCKAGFFNLAETNSKGCQPCFCFNHSNYCTSAVGYVAKLLQVANPSGDFTALFGDRHWSYGQLLTIKFTSTWNIDLSNQIILSLSGSGKVVHYIAPNSTVIGPSGSLSLVIRLLEQNWMMDGPESSIQPTAQDFLALLANLSAVTPITFWNGQPIVTSYIGLDWAEIKVGTTLAEINFVENCICSNTSHTAGMSCQRCSRGYRKEDLSNISSFSQCVACNCSKRGITDPPDCEESTGKCLDCRNGTTGDHCEMCAAHVIGPECDTCESTFWGLQADGCRDCNCSDPGATSNVCNTTSGQCTCATNVVGRACDQCQENFYNLTQAGCIECDSCYSLLKEAILPLHQLESDISSNVSALQANSVNTTFMTRYWEASNQTKQLTDFLTSMQLSEAVIKSNVYELNRTLLSLQTELDFMQHNSTVDIERLMTISDSTLQIALSYRSVIENNTVTVYNKLASLQVSQAKLSSLASSLKTVEQYLMMVASSSLVDQQIVNELSTLNNTLFLANQLLTSAQQKSEAANQIHKNNTSILLALDTRINALVSGAIKSLANAHKLANTSNDLLSTASNLKSKLSQFVNFKLDSASLASKMSETKSMTSSYQSQVVAESALFNTSNVNALTTVPIADNMSNSTRTLGLTAADWKNRASVASQKALFSQATASNMLQEANKTLLTLNNFTAKVQDSIQQVSALNVSLTSALTMSEQLILQSQTVTQTLAQLQQTASEAKLTAQQALGIIMIRQEEFRSVSMLSGKIQNKLNNSVDLSADRFRILTNTRLNILQPSVLQCSDLNSSVSNFKVQLSSAQLAVDRSYIQFANLTEQANSIIAQLNSLNKISPASVVALITNVQSAKELNLDELRMIISDLKTKKTAQKQQIDNLKLKRDDLNLKIQVLKSFQDQINKK
nr:laminin subunit alpha-1-like [Biomphalaria glabrata]